MMKQDSLDDATYEALITGLIDDHYGVADSFIDAELCEGLRQNLDQRLKSGKMHPASIGRKFSLEQNIKVRGDLISWIDNDSQDPYEKRFLEKIRLFIDYLNRTCYTSINAFEFHYATYKVGSFYKRHRDQFKSDSGRKFSFVTYLNEDWTDADGGSISIYLENQIINLYPLGGRVVFFKSDQIEHEVQPSTTRDRLSIAGWLKSV
jgi:SM-20-related protein